MTNRKCTRSVNCGVLNAHCYEKPELVMAEAALQTERVLAGLRVRIPNLVLETNHLGYPE